MNVMHKIIYRNVTYNYCSEDQYHFFPVTVDPRVWIPGVHMWVMAQ